MLGLKHSRIIVVDSEPRSREAMLRVLLKAGFDQAGIVLAGSADEARARLAEGPADLVVASLRLADGGSGLDVLAQARATWPGMARMLLCSFGDIERAGAALHSGLAQHLVRKPWDDVQLLVRLEAALRARLDDERRLHMVERAFGTAGLMRQQRFGPSRDLPALQAARPAPRLRDE